LFSEWSVLAAFSDDGGGSPGGGVSPPSGRRTLTLSHTPFQSASVGPKMLDWMRGMAQAGGRRAMLASW